MNELIVHAGLPKTATSSIQHSLSSNDEFLKSHNYEFLKINNIDGFAVSNHSVIFNSIFSDNPDGFFINIINNWDAAQVNRHYLQQLNRIKRPSGNNTLLISGEGISRLSEKWLREFLDYFSEYRIRIIIYVRHPYYWMCSRMSEVIRNGMPVSLDKNSLSKWIIQSSILEKFKRVQPSTEFYSYDEACRERGPVLHFIKLLNMNASKEFTEVSMNRGISNKLSRLGLYINSFEPGLIEQKPNLRRKGFQLNALEFSNEKFLLTRQEMEPLEDGLQKELKKIKEITGIIFDPEIRFSGNNKLSSEELNILVSKSRKLNINFKKLIWDFIRENSDSGENVRKELFSVFDRLRLS